MYKSLKIVIIDSKYCDYLRKFDYRVCFNAGQKNLRPFIGVLFTINDIKYFAPLSSPKEKHKRIKNTLDIIKIKNGEYVVVNFNNMIPVLENNYVILNLKNSLNDKNEKYRIELLKNQLRWLTANKKHIYFKSSLLYKLYKKDLLPANVKNRCCNYPLLEEKCKEYDSYTVL